jgi:hypothetical protein
MALKRVQILSPNFSSRGGATTRLIVLHTAQGSTSYESLGNYFQGNVQVSSHVGIDDKKGEIGEYVYRDKKAWTAANANPVAVQAELCGFAEWTTAQWHNDHPNMLDNCAKWIAEEAGKFGLPITKLNASQAQGSGRGVCQHVDLGSWGGGHWDCGSNFPIDDVLDMARGGGGGSSNVPPSPSPPGKAPAFPFNSSNYLGMPDGTKYWHDGHGGGWDNQHAVKPWQQQMSKRGWTIDVDGIYGSQSQAVAKQFQSEKGLSVDGRVGPQTWAATWTAPVT